MLSLCTWEYSTLFLHQATDCSSEVWTQGRGELGLGVNKVTLPGWRIFPRERLHISDNWTVRVCSCWVFGTMPFKEVKNHLGRQILLWSMWPFETEIVIFLTNFPAPFCPKWLFPSPQTIHQNKKFVVLHDLYQIFYEKRDSSHEFLN